MSKKNRKEFSKTLLIQESVLIWIITFGFFGLAAYCVLNNFLGTLPWLTGMAAFPWTAYGVSQAFYYNKSKAENTANGIKYQNMIFEKEEVKPVSADNNVSVFGADGYKDETDYIDIDSPI